MKTKKNTRDRNSGDWNSGNRNSGNGNSGNRNSGNRNSGDWNSGNWNSGDWNSGYWNSGNWNSGDRNSGNWNSGDWNSGNCNSGYFNTNEPKIRMFNKEIDVRTEDINFPSWLHFKLTEFIEYKDMSQEEKEKHPYAEYTQGYLKTYKYKEAFRNAFEGASVEDIKKTLKLPNFDYNIFEQISGINKEDIEEKLNEL